MKATDLETSNSTKRNRTSTMGILGAIGYDLGFLVTDRAIYCR